MKKKLNIRGTLILYDLIVFAIVDVMLLVLYDNLSIHGIKIHTLLSLTSIFICRFLGNIYRQIWRYGGIQCYIRLIFTDVSAFCLYFLSTCVLTQDKISFVRMLALVCMNLLGALTIRMIYRYAYKYSDLDTKKGKALNIVLHVFSGLKGGGRPDHQIKVAIIGAGRDGVSLAEELYRRYKKTGCKLKVYDYPIMQTAGGKRYLREFDVEELLFRKPVDMLDESTTKYYKDKVILITGGGSIGIVQTVS